MEAQDAHHACVQVTKLLETLPRSRQTLLFSATLPKQLTSITGLALRKDHLYVDCVGEESAETAILVEQRAVVVPKDEWLPRLAQVCLVCA
jgi:superfamily II DNA/RNA helicase